ncbi:MAG: coenzyme F420-0:L-glutamate ligase [Patescibacteria group bacterium]
MPNTELEANKDKNLTIKIEDKDYFRYPIKTHVFKDGDNLAEEIKKYLTPYLQKDDLVFISEKIVAISQGRAFHIDSIKPSKTAKFLSKFVHKTPYGIGIGSPWTMELALRQAGMLRISLGILASALTKPLGIRGVFYRVVGKGVSAIDGPCDYTLPPYNKYAKLPPANPSKVAKEIKQLIGNDVVIIDANDLGVDVLGKSSKDVSNEFCKAVFKDNPLGQTNEQTPLCIVRKV